MYIRPQHKVLEERLAEEPRSIILVVGPRQVGKTTLVRQTLNNCWNGAYEYHNLDETYDTTASWSTEGDHGNALAEPKPRDIAWLVRTWQAASEEAKKRHPQGGGDSVRRAFFVLALDEIHKVDGWARTVKGLWDADRRNNVPLHVIILGSSPLLMRQGVDESLAGRFETIRISHWSFAEMRDAFGFDLDRYLYFGGFPGAIDRIDDKNDPKQKRWADYVKESLISPTIRKDVLMTRTVEKPALLRQLFELCCAYSGQIVSLTKLKGDLANRGNETVLKGYLDLLEMADLIMGLRQYAARGPRQIKGPPKLQVLNTALISAYGKLSFKAAQADRSHWGRLTESAVGAHLARRRGSWDDLYHWRRNGTEVDFVLEHGTKVVAIEVKSSGTQSASTHPGLREFSRRHKGSATLLVGGSGMPVDEFLQSDLKEIACAAKT